MHVSSLGVSLVVLPHPTAQIQIKGHVVLHCSVILVLPGACALGCNVLLV